MPGRPEGGRAVRLEVERLDPVDRVVGGHVLDASGSAWAHPPVVLGAPALVAGRTRIAAVPGTPAIAADGDGRAWTATFEVPDAIARGAKAWSVEAPELPPVTSAPAAGSAPGVPAGAAGGRVAALVELLERSATAAAHRLDVVEDRRARTARIDAPGGDAGRATPGAEDAGERAVRALERAGAGVRQAAGERRLLRAALDRADADRLRLRRLLDDAAQRRGEPPAA